MKVLVVGPSRGLLRDYEPSDGPPFQALVWRVTWWPANVTQQIDHTASQAARGRTKHNWVTVLRHELSRTTMRQNVWRRWYCVRYSDCSVTSEYWEICCHKFKSSLIHPLIMIDTGHHCTSPSHISIPRPCNPCCPAINNTNTLHVSMSTHVWSLGTLARSVQCSALMCLVLTWN